MFSGQQSYVDISFIEEDLKGGYLFGLVFVECQNFDLIGVDNLFFLNGKIYYKNGIF